jgi:hypothetical protein
MRPTDLGGAATAFEARNRAASNLPRLERDSFKWKPVKAAVTL